MRSRYSAYCIENWLYILNTYEPQQRSTLSTQSLQESAEGTKWLHLQIVPTGLSAVAHSNEVEFKAFYAINHKLYVMHETSQFINSNGSWFYTTGTMHNDSGSHKIGRNDPCFCHSLKKFKQCCMRRV